MIHPAPSLSLLPAVAAAAADLVLDLLDDEMLKTVKENGEYICQQIEAMNIPCLGKTRGMGMMIGVEVKGDKTNQELALKLIENGLLILTAGADLRILPPLVITREEIDKGLAIIKQTLG